MMKKSTFFFYQQKKMDKHFRPKAFGLFSMKMISQFFWLSIPIQNFPKIPKITLRKLCDGIQVPVIYVMGQKVTFFPTNLPGETPSLANALCMNPGSPHQTQYHSLQQIKDKGPPIIPKVERNWRVFPGADAFFAKVEQRVTQAPLLDFFSEKIERRAPLRRRVIIF